ncbi:hypothetical protein HMP0721_1688 [Pseudoramibacter alactolyticus ATCC 23263]|uniref:Uncharacterized protein n=1 Tax=Pseudoramibacter alactolyticus ATCC 23263 TaxID=887929 RepID=E6MHY3_9FIRM|nr:hypothetical protein HMP0721_1688 [Pseudoramibacter alactolyticus ATCC 23263]
MVLLMPATADARAFQSVKFKVTAPAAGESNGLKSFLGMV